MPRILGDPPCADYPPFGVFSGRTRPKVAGCFGRPGEQPGQEPGLDPDSRNPFPWPWRATRFLSVSRRPCERRCIRSLWQQEKARFVQSYGNTCPTIRRVGYSEMTDHQFLTPDRSVQQTTFANGVTVTANFGLVTAQLPDGTSLEPMGFRVK